MIPILNPPSPPLPSIPSWYPMDRAEEKEEEEEETVWSYFTSTHVDCWQGWTGEKYFFFSTQHYFRGRMASNISQFVWA